ncbi:MAG: hypothetical protein DRO39_00190 [Thermoprotei archaeon]|nr:MAG: hypothetical protein DRO39_00190 [Thermoprotei archaeon]
MVMNRFSADVCYGELRRCPFLEVFLSKPQLVLVYGEAASGKTNLCLALLKLFSRCLGPAVYISTEGSAYADRVTELGIEEGHAYFAEAISAEHLLDLLTLILVEGPVPMLLVVDSVNRFYRMGAGTFENLRLFLSTLALLRKISEEYDACVVVTAQVREGAEDIEPSGFKYLLQWVDGVARLSTVSASVKELVVERPGKARKRFIITRSGLIWT